MSNQVKFQPRKISRQGVYTGDLWLDARSPALPAHLRVIDGGLDLREYLHPLPDTLERITGEVFLGEYPHPLPKRIASVGGLDLDGYQHALPRQLKEVTGDLMLIGYLKALPAGLARVGANIYLSDYPHPMPKKLVVEGAIIGAEDYEHELPRQPPVLSEHYKIRVPKSRNFKSWFGDSKVVDDSGEPVVAYSGTGRGGFATFKHVPGSEQEIPVFWFTSDLRQAATYTLAAKQHGTLQDPTPQVGEKETPDKDGAYRAWLKIENPFVFDAKGGWYLNMKSRKYPSLKLAPEIAAAAYRDGYDGVIFYNLRAPFNPGMYDEPADVYAVFEPTQIKSALFNRGTYDPKDPDIRKNPRRRTSRRARKKTSRG